MIPSLRLAIYFGLGVLLWVAAALTPNFIVVAVLYDLVLVFAAACDALLSPHPRDFEIGREVAEKMNLGAPNGVTLRARFRPSGASGARLPVRLTIRDEPPLSWPVQASHDKAGAAEGVPRAPGPVALPPVALAGMSLEAGQEGSGTYMVTPTRRGDFEFGALSARYVSYLGLWHRQFRQQMPARVRVYPDVTEVQRYELRLREGRLLDIGLHITRLRGRGTEFESLRDYTSDDEYKNINWKASARRGKLISTNYEIERDQTIILALDCGRMMTAMASLKSDAKAPSMKGSVGTSESKETANPQSETPVALSKLDCAINATVLLSHVAASMGDAVGLLLFSDMVTSFVPPRKGRNQTGAIIEALYAAQPSLVEPDYAAAYEHLLARRVRRALVITFTDLVDPDASRELLTASAALRQRHNALCVTINNRDVMDMAGMMPQTAGELYEKAMAQRMLAQRAGALEELRRRGVGILDVDAAHLTVAAVNRYLELKSRAAF